MSQLEPSTSPDGIGAASETAAPPVTRSSRTRLRLSLPHPGSDGFLTLCSIVGMFVLWQVASVLAGKTAVSHERYVPNVMDLVKAFKSLAYYWRGGLGVESTSDGGALTVAGAILALIYNSLATFARLAIGLTAAFLVAGLAATVVSWSGFLRKIFLLPAHAARMMPLVAISPLFGIWFGNSETGAVLFISFAAFAIVFVVAITAIDGVPIYYEKYARSLGAGRMRTYVTAVLPAALPALRGGVMLALGFGWSMVIAAEFIGQDVGLGNIVNRAQEFGRTSTLGVLAVFIVIYAWTSYKLATRAFDHLVRWAE